jgi:hypothetical protein
MSAVRGAGRAGEDAVLAGTVAGGSVGFRGEEEAAGSEAASTAAQAAELASEVAAASALRWASRGASCAASDQNARGVERLASTPTRWVLGGFLGSYRAKTSLPNSP